MMTRIDRLARSMKDLQDIVHELKTKGVALKATEQPIDTGRRAGKAFLDMFGVFAEFETNLRRERQMEGIAKAKVAGVYAKTREPAHRRRKVRELRAQGVGPPRSPSRLRIARSSVYRILGQSEGACAITAEAPLRVETGTLPSWFLVDFPVEFRRRSPDLCLNSRNMDTAERGHDE